MCISVQAHVCADRSAEPGRWIDIYADYESSKLVIKGYSFQQNADIGLAHGSCSRLQKGLEKNVAEVHHSWQQNRG